jgi:hypothetical protein
MRPVHYHASGGGSLRFDCYMREVRAWVTLPTPRRSPPPRRHTDLRKVTCAECWRAIRRMAEQHVGLVDAVARQHLPTRGTRG